MLWYDTVCFNIIQYGHTVRYFHLTTTLHYNSVQYAELQNSPEEYRQTHVPSTTLKGALVKFCSAIRYITVDTARSPPECRWPDKSTRPLSCLNRTFICISSGVFVMRFMGRVKNREVSCGWSLSHFCKRERYLLIIQWIMKFKNWSSNGVVVLCCVVLCWGLREGFSEGWIWCGQQFERRRERG